MFTVMIPAVLSSDNYMPIYLGDFTLEERKYPDISRTTAQRVGIDIDIQRCDVSQWPLV